MSVKAEIESTIEGYTKKGNTRQVELWTDLSTRYQSLKALGLEEIKSPQEILAQKIQPIGSLLPDSMSLHEIYHWDESENQDWTKFAENLDSKERSMLRKYLRAFKYSTRKDITLADLRNQEENLFDSTRSVGKIRGKFLRDAFGTKGDSEKLQFYAMP